jgi:hypothetical protein
MIKLINQQKKIKLSIKSSDKFIKVYLNETLFLNQKILISNNKFLNNKVYTLFYIFKVMYRFGLSSPISKKYGYNK